MEQAKQISNKTSEGYGEPVIEVSGLYKSFGNNHVLTDYNLTVKRGESVAVLGKSGCGKSVLIKCIIGLLPYDAGSVKVFNKEISSLTQHELDELRARIGFVFQSSALYDSMTVRENLEFALRRHGKHKSKDDEPTTGLDPITSGEIINLMLNVQKKYNTSAIIISHDMHCARLTANRLSVIVNGVNYKQGTFEEVKNFNDPQTHPFFE